LAADDRIVKMANIVKLLGGLLLIGGVLVTVIIWPYKIQSQNKAIEIEIINIKSGFKNHCNHAEKEYEKKADVVMMEARLRPIEENINYVRTKVDRLDDRFNDVIKLLMEIKNDN